MGSFNAERYWKEEHYATLPSIENKAWHNIIVAMDELLFPMTHHGDVLVTAYKMDDTLKDYISMLGFHITNNDSNIVDHGHDSKEEKSIFEHLLMWDDTPCHPSLLSMAETLSPYSILPYTKELCEKYGWTTSLPPLACVKKVNSKVYSYEVNRILGLHHTGSVVTNSKEFMTKGNEYLTTGSFLIKDPYGVSGKGNLLIHSKGIFNRIVSYMEKQEKQGKQVLFVMEPFLDKDVDFSCQLYIEKEGNYTILSVQKLHNNAFSFYGSYSADEDFYTFLDDNHYFDDIQKIVKQLHGEGYFGNVCIDSMILKNGDIIPIIEINARQSMGLINHYMDRYLAPYALTGNLTFMNMGYANGINFNTLIEQMDKHNLLFTPGKEEGIIPLSSNTLFINSYLSKKKTEKDMYKGRFYFSAVGKSHGEKNELIAKNKDFFLSLGFKIYD